MIIIYSYDYEILCRKSLPAYLLYDTGLQFVVKDRFSSGWKYVHMFVIYCIKTAVDIVHVHYTTHNSDFWLKTYKKLNRPGSSVLFQISYNKPQEKETGYILKFPSLVVYYLIENTILYDEMMSHMIKSQAWCLIIENAEDTKAFPPL